MSTKITFAMRCIQHLYVSLLAAAMLLVITFLPALAHEQQPAIADLTFENGQAQLNIIFNAEAILAGISPDHENTDDAPEAERYNQLRGLAPDELEQRFNAESQVFIDNLRALSGETEIPLKIDSLVVPPIGNEELIRESIIVVSGPLPKDAEAMTFAWTRDYGPIVLRVAPRIEGDETFASYVDSGAVSPAIPISAPLPTVSAFQAFADYIPVGFDHIIPKGLDHILFVVGLFLFSTKLKPLLIQITTFTIAHTITLALASLGIVTISGAIVEPLIALSIAYVAIENIFASKLGAWRTVVIFAFGLLHGLGFASVLADFGIGQSNFIASLIGFNVGVEIGQLTVIAVCFLAVGFWFGKKPWYRKVVVIPASLLIAAIGLYWAYERVFL